VSDHLLRSRAESRQLLGGREPNIGSTVAWQRELLELTNHRTGELDISNILNLGLFLLTGVGVWVAIAQARDAGRAREGADRANAQAALHEKAAADAAERSASASEHAVIEQRRTADALERQAAAVETASIKRDEWDFELTESGSDQRWRVINRTGENVTSVTIGTPSGTDERWIQPESADPVDVEADGAVYFWFQRRLEAPSTATIWVHWTAADGTSPQKRMIRHLP
jgi:hypothetical protein